ncbi:hypothetical protein BV20DRAFT_613101 [Pilatotrama ljubarskyi]|nr:hypothetical protein BV20DRAFT_613101 [Pilatotrama ljubarskyi]
MQDPYNESSDKSRSPPMPDPDSEHGDQSGLAQQRHRDYIRNSILHHHLEQTLRKAASTTTSQSLTLSAALHTFPSPSSSSDHGGDTRIAGGLSQDDLAKMAPVALPVLKDAFLEQLEDELKGTLLSIVDYYSPKDDEGFADEVDRVQTAPQLPERIRQRKAALAQQRALVSEARNQVLELVQRINDTHPALESALITALQTLPPHLRAARAAEADVLAATIEAALLKLSLLRARAHRALYGFSLPSSGQTVSRAVAVAHMALLSRQRAQDEEMKRLDGQIAAYEGVLRLVDGGRGGEGGEGAFGQVVRDMARVKRETEECRRDLRRLGWTGD